MSYISDWEHSDKSEWDYIQYRNATYRENAEERYYCNHCDEYEYDDDDDDYEDED